MRARQTRSLARFVSEPCPNTVGSACHHGTRSVVLTNQHLFPKLCIQPTAMDEKVKKYTKDGVTVIWKPDLCIHSTRCWKGLVAVFNPKLRPWINMEGAPLDEIMKQVSACPSGALSFINTEVEKEGDTHTETTTAVEVMKNGPLMVYGNLTVKDAQGQETHKHKVTAFCRCGASANKPYCDGSHMRIGFKDAE